LEILKLDDNRFSSLPRNIGLLSNLQILSIRNNMMGGTLHSALGTLRSLKALYLNHNSFTSTIPIEFGGLTNLVDGLDLSSNSLSGQVPSELGRLTALSKLFDDIITVVLWYRSSVLYCIAIHSIDQPCCWPYLLPSLQRIYF
jgi:Leucine-rich repeat (LRR) protein